MTEILHLRGGAALSPFRRAKLITTLRERVTSVADVGAEFWHFVEVDDTLDTREREVLERVLTYGENGIATKNGATLLVTPRVGTMSPWSSKATDIARNCGLAKVRRIERGIVYTIVGAELNDAQLKALTPLLARH